MIWGYNVFVDTDTAGESKWTDASKDPDKVTIETNAQAESMKYPFKETLLDSMEVVQHYYDMEADEATREKSLLVFNQTYVANTGVSLSMNGLVGRIEEVVEKAKSMGVEV